MKYLSLLFTFFLFSFINAEEIVIYSTESAQYSANDCCTLNSLTIQNGGTLFSQDCQDMGNYGCGMAKYIPLWSFDLSSLDSSININSVQFSGNIIEQDWSDVYLSMSSMSGGMSSNIASHLWSGGDNSFSGINWSQGTFSQNLPVNITLEGVLSGQLNILAFTSNPWQIFSIDNSGDDAPRLIIEYESIDEQPELEVIVGQQTYEDTPFLVEVTATSPIGSQITYNALSDTSAIPVYMDGNSVAIGLQVNWNGIGNVTVIATDENQMSDTTTFSVTVLPVNDSPVDFELIYPTVLDTIPISVDTDETVPFIWEESIDVDSEVLYKLTITLDYFGTVYTNVYENITDTTFGISAYEYAILMTNLNLPRWNMDYVIKASDEEFTIVSEAGEFVFENTSLSIDDEIIPEVFALHQNYPNPFNPITSLRYDLPEDGLVNITVYDMMGRIVKTLVNSSQTAGYKSIRWNATNNRNEPVSAGLYLYTIQAGEYRQTKKMILLK